MRFEDEIKQKAKKKKQNRTCLSRFVLLLSNGMDVGVYVTLDDKMHWGGCGSTAGLDRAHVLAFVRHVHIFDLDGELVLVQSHQTHSGIHRPLVFPGVEDARPVQPSCVRDHVPLRASEIAKRQIVYESGLRVPHKQHRWCASEVSEGACWKEQLPSAALERSCQLFRNLPANLESHHSNAVDATRRAKLVARRSDAANLILCRHRVLRCWKEPAQDVFRIRCKSDGPHLENHCSTPARPVVGDHETHLCTPIKKWSDHKSKHF